MIRLKKRLENFGAVWILFLMVMNSSCSLSSFFGNGKDRAVLEQRQYRQINRNCGGMDLKSSELNAQTVRGLISCFNSSGALEKTQALFNRIENSELDPLIRFLNQAILNDPKRLYEFEMTYQSLAQTGLHDDVFALTGDLLKQPALIVSFLKVLRSGYYVKDESANSALVADQNILKAIQLVVQALDDAKFRQALDLGVLAVRAPSFESLRAHLLEARFPGETKEKRDEASQRLVSELLSYLREDHTFQCGSRRETLGRELGWLARHHLVFPVLGELLGTNTSEVEMKLPKINQLFQGLLSQPNQSPLLLDQLASSFYALSPDHSPPIACMKGVKSIPDATRYLIREMLRPQLKVEEYISHDAPLTLMALRPFCSFPDQLTDHYQSLHALVDSGVTVPMIELMRTLHDKQFVVDSDVAKDALCPLQTAYPGEPFRPWIDFVMHSFADGGPNGQGGIHHLSPVLQDALSRGLLTDALLLATIYGDQQKSDLNSVLTFVTELKPELGNQSLTEVFSGAAARASLQDVLTVIKGVGGLLAERDGKLVQSLMETGRKIHYVNDVTPFLGLMRRLGSQASESENRKLFEALFSIVDRQSSDSDGRSRPMSEVLTDALSEWSVLSSNGEMKAITESMFQLFHKYAIKAQEGPDKITIRETAEPAFNLVPNHSLKVVPAPLPAPSFNSSKYLACRQMDLNFSLADTHDETRFSAQLDYFLACKQKSDSPSDQKIWELFDRSNFDNSESHGFLSYQLNALNGAFGGLESPSLKYLVQGWMDDFKFTGIDRDAEADSLSQNSWFRSLKAIPFFTKKGPGSEMGTDSLLKSLLFALEPVVREESSLKRVEDLEVWIADVLKGPEFPKLLSDAEALLKRAQTIHSRQATEEFQQQEKARKKVALDQIYTPEIREVLTHWVQSVECWRGPHFDVARRVEEIIQESKERVTTHDLVGSLQSPQVHRSWDFESMRSEIEPVLVRMRDQKLSDPKRPLLESTLNLVKSALGPVGAPGRRYTPEKLLGLFHKRALRVRPRIQYYRGHDQPYVVLDSDLDLLEKTLKNVDLALDVPPGKNLALQFSQEIADAWGDLPADQWPEIIIKKYQVAYDLALKNDFKDVLVWSEEVARRSYEQNRPRTLHEAVEGILHRPAQHDQKFNPWTIGAQIAGWKLGVYRPQFDYSRYHGLEDIRILTENAAGLPPLPQCIQDNIARRPKERRSSHSEEFGTEVFRIVELPPSLDRPEYQQPPVPATSEGHPLIKEGLIRFKGGLNTARGERELKDMQGMLFNLWQAVDSLRENVPGSPGNDDGGLLPVMRDIFFEVYYSNLESIRSQPFPATLQNENQLSLMGHVVRLGAMHRVGQLLQHFELGDPGLEAVFRTLIRGGSAPELLKLIKTLLEEDSHNDLIWHGLEGLLTAKPAQIDELMRASFSLLSFVDRVDPWVAQLDQELPPRGVANLALTRAEEALTHFYFWFSGHTKNRDGDISVLAKKILDSGWGSAFAQALDQVTGETQSDPGCPERWNGRLQEGLSSLSGIDLRKTQSEPRESRLCEGLYLTHEVWKDSGAWHSLENLVRGVQRLQEDPSFKALKLEDALRPMLDFLEEKPPQPGVEIDLRQRVAAAQALRQSLAHFMTYKQGGRSSELNELVKFSLKERRASIGSSVSHLRNADLLLDILNQLIEDGQMIEFLKLIRRSLPEN